MEINISGLKCDYCNYRDDEVQFSEYKNSIGRLCPVCGNNLLTEKEYFSCLRYHKTIDVLNKINNVVKWINPFHYWRLIFGDKREINSVTLYFKNRSKNESN